MVEKYTKDLKESLYHATIISALGIDYTMIGKSLMMSSPPPPPRPLSLSLSLSLSLFLGTFDVENGVKLVAIVAICFH